MLERIAAFELLGVFLLSIEAIKVDNLLGVAKFGMDLFYRFDKWADWFMKKATWRDWGIIPVVLLLGAVILLVGLFVIPVDYMFYFLFPMLFIIGPFAVITFGLVGSSLLLGIIASLMYLVSVALKYTPTGTTGAIGFLLFLVSWMLRFYLTFNF